MFADHEHTQAPIGDGDLELLALHRRIERHEALLPPVDGHERLHEPLDVRAHDVGIRRAFNETVDQAGLQEWHVCRDGKTEVATGCPEPGNKSCKRPEPFVQVLGGPEGYFRLDGRQLLPPGMDDHDLVAGALERRDDPLQKGPAQQLGPGFVRPEPPALPACQYDSAQYHPRWSPVTPATICGRYDGRVDLIEAFDLPDGAIVAAVGGGGKTSLVYALAAERAGRGGSALVTSTVRFTRPAGTKVDDIVETADTGFAEAVRGVLSPGRVTVAHRGHGLRGRMHGFAPETLRTLGEARPGIVAIEADGSAHRPFKAPADHEPVIPEFVTDVIVCVGLSVLGCPIGPRDVHRPDLVARISGRAMGAPVTGNTVSDVLLAHDGGRKGVPRTARLHALLNAPPAPEYIQVGSRIGATLVYGGYVRAVIATAHQHEVYAVVQ